MTPVLIYVGTEEGKPKAVKSEKEKPAYPMNGTPNEWDSFHHERRHYKDYLASLPRIECSPELVEGLKPGDVLPPCEEGYEVKRLIDKNSVEYYWAESYWKEYSLTNPEYRRIILVPVEAKIDLSYKKFCEKCYGIGEVNKNISYGGELQADFPVECPECNGTGRIEEQGEDELWLWGQVIEEVLSDTTFHNKGLDEQLKSKYTITRKQ